jgi:hypothetical protein
MNFDLRLPIGLMFSFYGVLLVIYGAVTNGQLMYERSLGKNVNLLWGIVLAVFGGLMLFAALRSKKPKA